MEVVSDKKLCLLYVGANQKMVDQFLECGDKVDFHVAKNAVLAIHWLEKNKKVDAVICEKQIPGQSGIAFH